MRSFWKYFVMFWLAVFFSYYLDVYLPERNLIHLVVSGAGLIFIIYVVSKVFDKKRENGRQPNKEQ